MTRRRALAAMIAGLVAAGCSHGPTEAARPADPTGTADADSGDAVPRCRRELAEMDRRDEAGSIDWQTIEGPDEEPTEAELAEVTIEGEPFAGDVVAEGERPTFPDFPDRLDIAQLSDVELVEAVDTCYEIGLLSDAEEDGEEAGD
jgi:hypothetical protein